MLIGAADVTPRWSVAPTVNLCQVKIDEVFWRKVIAHLAIPFLLAAALSLTFSALRSLGNGGSFLFVLDTTRLLLGLSRSRQLRGSKG